MIGAPGAERRVGVVSRIDEDEDGPAGLQRDRELQRKVAPGGPGGSPVHAYRQFPAFDAEGPAHRYFLRLGRKPPQAGVLQHVVEGEQAPERGFRRGRPAVADVLGGQVPVDQGADESEGLSAVRVEMEAELRPDEDAAVEAGQGDPFGLFARPTEDSLEELKSR